jgi:hypothetical protein
MERPSFDKVPLGDFPKVVRISQAEMHLAYLHRQETGEPIQSWVRRLIRENARGPGSTKQTDQPSYVPPEQPSGHTIHEAGLSVSKSAPALPNPGQAHELHAARRQPTISPGFSRSPVTEQTVLREAYETYRASFAVFPSKGYERGTMNGFLAGWEAHRAALRTQIQHWRERSATEIGAAADLFLAVATILEETLNQTG